MGAASKSNTDSVAQTPLTKILSQELQPISVLNDALSMAYDPCNLPAFANPQLVPSYLYTMIFYQGSREKSRSRDIVLKGSAANILRERDSAYILVCAQLISISLQANLLGDSELNEYLAMIKRTPLSGSASSRGSEFLLAFGSHVSRVIYNKFSRTSEVLREMYKTRSTTPPEPLSLPTLDELGQDSAEYLLLVLYEERDMILAARHGVPTCWQGWSVLLYQLWVYMRGIKLTKRMTVFLRDLVCRFGIVSAGDINEDNLLLLIEEHLEDTSGDWLDDERNCPVDYADTRIMAEAFAKRFSNNSPPSMKFSIAILRWILPGLSEKSRLLLPAVVEASVRRIWHAIETGDAQDNRQKGLLIEFTQNLFLDVRSFLRDSRVRESDKVSLVKMLMKEEFFSMAGRVMLLISIGGLTKTNAILCKEAITLISARRECIQETFKYIGQLYTATQTEFQIWFRIFIHTRHLFALYPRVGMIISAHDEWWEIGVSMGFSRFGGWPICSWPRCSAPHGPVWVACGGCDTAGYCSQACQVAHWVVDSPINCHKDECSKLAKERLKLNYKGGKNPEVGKYEETWIRREKTKRRQPPAPIEKEVVKQAPSENQVEENHSESEFSVCVI